MPISTCRTPASTESAISSSRIGTIMSSPSIENRVLPVNALWRNFSKVSTSVMRSRRSTSSTGAFGARNVPGLDVVAQPLALLGHENVREVEADARAVHRAQTRDGLAGMRRAFGQRPADEAGRQRGQVRFAHAMGVGQQRRIADRIGAQRVESRREVTVAPNRLREVDGADDGG